MKNVERGIAVRHEVEAVDRQIGCWPSGALIAPVGPTALHVPTIAHLLLLCASSLFEQVPVIGWAYVEACNREDKAAGKNG